MMSSSPERVRTAALWALTAVSALAIWRYARAARSYQREAREHHDAEAALRHKNRFLRLFYMYNTAVVHATDERALLAELCRIAVDVAGHRMAWVGRAERDEARTVRPLAFAGAGAGFLERVRVSWADDAYGHGMAGTAIRARRSVVTRDLLRDPNFAVWREVLCEYGFASAIALPLWLGEEVYGVLVVYATEADAFDSTEATLLDELADNISYGLMALCARKELAKAMAALELTRSELEQRVEQRTRELVLAMEAAESADRLKSAFLATMSHELRTPLNSIIGFTGILLQRLAGPLTHEQAKQLGMVQASSRHLLALINDVLDISKIEAGQLEMHREPFDVVASLERVVQALKPLASKKGLALDMEIGAGLGAVVGDQRRVEQIATNLLGNAVKFTERGGVTLRCAARGGRLELAVQDTGIGIAREHFQDIFSPFHQLDTGLSRTHEGTGLGLSICKRLVERMGGNIALASTEGVGSTFTVTIPLPRGEA